MDRSTWETIISLVIGLAFSFVLGFAALYQGSTPKQHQDASEQFQRPTLLSETFRIIIKMIAIAVALTIVIKELVIPYIIIPSMIWLNDKNDWSWVWIFVKYPENWFIRIFRAKELQPSFVNRIEKKNT